MPLEPLDIYLSNLRRDAKRSEQIFWLAIIGVSAYTLMFVALIFLFTR